MQSRFSHWLGAGLLVGVAPFITVAVARAQTFPGDAANQDDAMAVLDSVPPAEDSFVEDAASPVDAADSFPSLPQGDSAPPPDLVMDTPPGCTCSTAAIYALSAGPLSLVLAPSPLVVLIALAVRRAKRK